MMKGNSQNESIIKLLYVVLIFSLLCPAVSSGQDQALNSLNITAKLYNPKDDSLMDLTGREMKLTSKKVIWKEGDSIQKLLEANGFFMDGESLGILYKLDPDLNAKSLKAGKELIVPAVKNKEEFSHEFHKGYLVWLTLDDDLKQEFRSVSKELSSLPAKTSGLDVQKFESSGERDNFVKATKLIAETMKNFEGVIKERSDPLDSDMLTQMLIEAEQAKFIILNAINGKQKLSRSDAQTLDLIGMNMTSRKSILGAEEKGKGQGQLPGVVKTPEGVMWNAWFEEYTSKKDEENALVVGTRYVVNVDLSKYYYRERYAAIPDSRLAAKISGESVTLILRPIIIGELITAVLDKPFESKELTVNSSRKSPGHAEKAKAYEAGTISTSEFASYVNLGSIVSWDIVAKSPGCATLAFSVWNDAFTEPLDHVLVTFPVINKGEKPPEDCGLGVKKKGVKQKGMQAKLDTLLLIGPTGAGAEGKLADAALHVFEVSPGGKKRSIAVFVNHDELKEARKTPSAKHKGVYAWELSSALSDYISKPSQLPKLITDAHDYATKGITCPYMDVPADLDAAIFGAVVGQNLTQAQLARESLNRLKQGAVVLTHLVSADGGVIYLPLGLLAAKTQDTPDVPTDRRFTVLQTLPQQRPIEKACIGSWMFAMPTKLGGVDSGDEANTLKKNAPPANAWLKNHEELLGYFGAKRQKDGEKKTADLKSTRGEGLILLAHHDDGYIWYSESEVPARIKAGMIAREFPAGSVAILAACSTSGSCKENRALVEKLNQQGIEAIILSPFAVVPAFGIRLALEFQEHALAEFQKKSDVTFLELFQRALNATIKAFDKKKGYQDMALEFQVVGRASLRLCNEQSTKGGKP